MAAKTKNHPWDRAASVPIRSDDYRVGESLDPGVNFFVLALRALGAKTRFSCEGHPTGFYITFEAPYKLALEVKSAGFFRVEIEGEGYWSIRRSEYTHDGGPYTEKVKVDVLRWATEAWIRTFGDRLAGLDCLKPLPEPVKKPRARAKA